MTKQSTLREEIEEIIELNGHGQIHSNDWLKEKTAQLLSAFDTQLAKLSEEAVTLTADQKPFGRLVKAIPLSALKELRESLK